MEVLAVTEYLWLIIPVSLSIMILLLYIYDSINGINELKK